MVGNSVSASIPPEFEEPDDSNLFYKSSQCVIVTISVYAELNCVSGVMYCIWFALLIWDYFSEFQPFCFHVTQKGKPKSLSTQVFISAENNLSSS